MLNANCQCTKPWNSRAHVVASNIVRDLLFGLVLVETSCLGQTNSTPISSFFFHSFCCWFFFFLLFFSYKTLFVRVPILKDYPYTLQIFGMQTREKWSLFPSRNNTFSLISSICLLETQVWKYFKIRLVSSEKYKLSLFS